MIASAQAPTTNSPPEWRSFLDQRLPQLCAVGARAGNDSGYALPDATLEVLRSIVEELRLERVFEFGTGRSTKMFLDCGCLVTAMEDSKHWLGETVKALSQENRVWLRAHRRPLHTVFDRGVPFKSWPLHEPIVTALRRAQLVLIDSPAFPPFREHAFIMSLTVNRGGIIVLDDANIPTVQRFCARLCEGNQLASFKSPQDHGLFFALPPAHGNPLDTARGVTEAMKAWRRFFMAPRKRRALNGA